MIDYVSLSTGCHPEHAVWQLLRISAWTMAVGALGLESYTNCCSSEALKAPCKWFTEKGCLVILPSAKGKLRKQRKMRNVSKYNSPLCSAMFFFSLWRWRCLLFMSQHLFPNQCLRRLLKSLWSASLSLGIVYLNSLDPELTIFSIYLFTSVKQHLNITY